MLKLRFVRPIVRQVQHSRSFSSFYEAAQTPEVFNPALAAEGLWRDIQNKRLWVAAKSYGELRGEEKRLSVEPYLVAKAEQQRPQEVKDTLLYVMEKYPDSTTPAQIGILLHSYAVVDKLGSAERLIQQWLQNYITSHPNDKHAVELHTKLVNGSASAAVGAQNVSRSEIFDEAMTEVGQSEIPLSAWVAMLTIYGRHRAWRQCVDIMAYLEHKRDTKQAYTIDLNESNGVLMRNLSELMLPTYVVTTEFTALTNDFADRSRGVDTSNIAVLQWAALYNITLRALVETHQYTAATDLLRRMRALSGDAEGSNQMAQIPAAISLLSALSGPLNPLQDLLSRGVAAADIQEPLRHSIEVRQTLARSLLGSVACAVKTLAVPVTVHPTSVAAVTTTQESGNSNSDSHINNKSVEKGDITAYSLARQYVLLLCRLDLLEDCKLFVTDVRTHILNVRYGRAHQHNNFVSTNTVAGVEIIDKVIPVAGFWEDGWIAPYFRRCRELDRWAEAAALYDDLQETKRFEDGVRRANLHHPENTTGAWLREYKDIVERRQHGEGGVDDFVTPKQTPLKRSAAYMYHDTAAALRKAGEFQKLAELMKQHQVLVQKEATATD